MTKKKRRNYHGIDKEKAIAWDKWSKSLGTGKRVKEVPSRFKYSVQRYNFQVRCTHAVRKAWEHAPWKPYKKWISEDALVRYLLNHVHKVFTKPYIIKSLDTMCDIKPRVKRPQKRGFKSEVYSRDTMEDCVSYKCKNKPTTDRSANTDKCTSALVECEFRRDNRSKRKTSKITFYYRLLRSSQKPLLPGELTLYERAMKRFEMWEKEDEAAKVASECAQNMVKLF